MNADVIITGLGPAGAALCGLLARRGVKVIGLEKSRDVFPLPRAAHVDHTGLRTVQELGCLDALLPQVIRNQSLDLVNAGHELLLRVDASQPSVSGLPTSVYFYQPDFDQALRQAITAMPGVEARFGTEMTGFTQDAEGVSVQTRDDQGRDAVLRARWLVGCDGAWSPVREAIGSRLDSLNFDERWLVLDIDLKAEMPALPADRVVQVCDPARPHLTTPISKGRQRFEFMLLEGDDPEAIQQPESVARLLASWLAPESYSVARRAIYTFHGLVADRWRVGRVLIAGDAAHMMPPFLGQGMCSGLRDTANLAWKLAAVVRDGAPVALLDTYQAERSPHVKRITEAAIDFGRLVCMTDPAAASARDRRLLAADPDERERLSFQLPRLEPGPLVLDGGGGLFIQPEIDGRLLDDLVGPRFLVLARDDAALGASAGWWRGIGAQVTTLAALNDPACARWMDRFEAGVVVVRPDRYVLGTGGTLDAITAKVQSLLASETRAPGQAPNSVSARRGAVAFQNRR